MVAVSSQSVVKREPCVVGNIYAFPLWFEGDCILWAKLTTPPWLQSQETPGTAAIYPQAASCECTGATHVQGDPGTALT